MSKSDGTNGKSGSDISPMALLIEAGATMDEVGVIRDLDHVYARAQQRGTTDEEVLVAFELWLERLKG